MNIKEYLLVCFNRSVGFKEHAAGVVAAKALIHKGVDKDNIIMTVNSMKKSLSYDFLKGVKRGINLCS